MGPDSLRSEVTNVEDIMKNANMDTGEKCNENSNKNDLNSKSPSKMNVSETEEPADRSIQNGNESELGTIATDTSEMPPSAPISKPSVRGSQNSNNSVSAKYCNTDVPRLFPDYYVGKIVRIPRSFGPDESSTLPIIRRNGEQHSRLPAKYTNTDVSQFSPDFHAGKISQFPGSSGAEESATSPKIRHNGEQHEKLNQVGNPCVDELSKITGSSSERAIPPLSPAVIAPDDNCYKPVKNMKQEKGRICTNSRIADWRYGPAQLWYDMLDVPESGEGFDYGFKLKKTDNNNIAANKEVIQPSDNSIPDESFLMVVQITWEDDIIWEVNEEIRQKVKRNLNRNAHVAGWLPYNNYRSAQFFDHPRDKSNMSGKNVKADNADDTWYSVFPTDNEELIHGIWEDEIIWDSEAVSRIPYPKLPTLDLNDENIIFEVSDDVDPQKQKSDPKATPVKVETHQPCVKKSKPSSSKELDEDTPSSQSPNLDPFNISNDSYYLPKPLDTSLKLKLGAGNLIQHSTPVIELQAPFVQTQIGPMRLRNFHRPSLKQHSNGDLTHPGPHFVTSLTNYVKKMAEEREQLRVASGGGNVFFMRTAEDLTGRDGELILIEFSEEHPPLINQVGMCSKIRNYYKRKATKDQNPTKFRCGEVAYAHTSPFLGNLPPGETIQVIENNMYRAPIHQHKIPQTDFLVIRTRHQYYIREVDALFTAGQLCPLYEVPSPHSKISINFVRDFFLVFIYRLFRRCEDLPRRIRFDDVMRAFPSHPEATIRKRLRLCADLKIFGNSWWWVLKPDFILPSEEQIRAMVSPEQYCAYFSAIAAEQRLYDAGYGEKSLFAPLEDDHDLLQKLDDEVKAAPWNTTRAYIQAMKGKCMLQLNGPADPTGCDEGFSYIQVPIKPTSKENEEEQKIHSKKILDDMGADLQHVSVNTAKTFLKKYGIPEKVMKKLNQWEIIEIVHTLSKKKAKVDGKRLAKFCQKNRFSAAKRQRRYEKECQRIFDLQNKVLSSREILSSDEGESSDDDDSDIEEMGRNIELMLTNKKTSTQLQLEREEQERKELRKMVRDDNLKQDVKKERVLKIYRTYRDSNGNEFTRLEVVRNQGVIDAYVKVRTFKTKNFIEQFAVAEVSERKEMELKRKRNRSLTVEPSQDPSKCSEIPTKMVPCAGTVSVQKRCPVNVSHSLKVRCGACGAIGHMRSNRKCPRYQFNTPPRPLSPPPPTARLVPIQELEDDISKQTSNKIENPVSSEGTKLTISDQLIKFHEVIKRQSDAILKNASTRKRPGSTDNQVNENAKRRFKPANLCRTDPLVVLMGHFEKILNEIQNIPNVQYFMFPVNAEVVPGYDKIIRRPMDLQTMRDKITQKKYKSRGDFVCDLNQIVLNSSLYNGATSPFTLAGKHMLDLCIKKLKEKSDQLIKLEKEIDLLLNNDRRIRLSFVLQSILDKLTRIPESFYFMKPTDKKTTKVCYDVIARPMDLETIAKKVKTLEYHSKNEFLGDIELVYNNCVIYNGRKSIETEKAIILVKAAKTLVEEYGTRTHSSNLEQQIKKIPEVKINSVPSSCHTKDERQYQKGMNGSSINTEVNTESEKNSEKQIDSKNFAEARTEQTSESDEDSSSSSSSSSSEDDETDDNVMEKEEVKSDHVTAIDRDQTQITATEDLKQLESLTLGQTNANNVDSRTAEHDFHSANDNDMPNNKNRGHKLTSGVSVEANVLLDDLKISDDEDEIDGKNKKIPVESRQMPCL